MISHDKFIDKIKQYIDEKKLFSFGDHVIIGLSGGADSVCLLLVLKRLQQIYNLSITAIHVHHGIRGESAEHDLKFSRQLCEKEEIEFVEKRCDVPALAAKHHLTEEEAGRRVRYETFECEAKKRGASVIAVAHHMDDQAETVLMHLIYGSGMAGLSGMRELSGAFWRPLLSVRRTQIRDALTALHQPWREDESNQDTAYTRNHLRARALPALEQANASAVPAICRAADILRQEDGLLNHLAQDALSGACGRGMHRFILLKALTDQEPAMQRRMLRVYAAEAGLALDYEQTERLRALLDRADGSYANVPGDWRALRTRTRLHLLPPKADACTLDANALCILPFAGKRGDGRLTQVVPENVLARGIELRTRQTGDFIRPFGMQGTKKLKDYLIDRQIDLPFRDDWPLVCQGSEVLWVIGVGASETLRAAPGDQAAKLLAYTGILPDAI